LDKNIVSKLHQRPYPSLLAVQQFTENV